MGSALGKISVETPKYNVTAKGEDYEIREYPPQLAAEVTYDPTTMKGGVDGGFMILASYIGAVGEAANIKPAGEASEKIAMTAPVLTQETQKGEYEKIAMTAPVITQENKDGSETEEKLVTMQFILPAEYTSVGKAPKPKDSRVIVKQIPSRQVGVITFSGVADIHSRLVEKKLLELKSAVEKAGYSISGVHSLARYNPPWTPGFLRTNEVLVPLE